MQVKKIIRVQAMMRGFLAKKHKNKPAVKSGADQDKAALQIQSAYRGFKARKEYGPLLCAKTGKIDIQTAVFINPYAKRWKSKSLFQVLLLYRAARYQDLVNFSQQIHFFNQHVYETQMLYNEDISLSRINASEVYASQLGFAKPSVLKMPFRFRDIPFFDTTDMCKLFKPSNLPFTVTGEELDEAWDAPFQRQYGGTDRRRSRNPGYGGYMPEDEMIMNIAYSREPNMQIG
jgi:myosin III